ncbi:MAG: hypothetical protein ACOYOB_17205, partial [Myxococcota bacterium]
LVGLDVHQTMDVVAGREASQTGRSVLYRTVAGELPAVRSLLREAGDGQAGGKGLFLPPQHPSTKIPKGPTHFRTPPTSAV